MVSDVKSDIAPLFLQEVITKYNPPPSGVNDVEGYDAEYIARFNILFN